VTSLAQMHQLDAVGTTFRIHRLEASIELSNLIQGTLGWVAGSAWSDYLTWLYPSMRARSTTFVGFAANVGVAVLYGAIAILWLVSLGKDPNTPPWNEALAREDVEQYFLTGAMSFFVGWAWILVLRAIYVPFGETVGVGVAWAYAKLSSDDSLLAAPLLARLFGGADAPESGSGSPPSAGLLAGLLEVDAAALSEVSMDLTVALIIPTFTAAFFLSKHRLKAAYVRAVGLRSKTRWVLGARHAGSKKLSAALARNEMMMVVKRAAQQGGVALSRTVQVRAAESDTTALLSDQDKQDIEAPGLPSAAPDLPPPSAPGGDGRLQA